MGELIDCELYLTKAVREKGNESLIRIGREGKGAEKGWVVRSREEPLKR